METARFLAAQIGPRAAGSEQERRASDYLSERLRAIGAAAETRRFTFRGWRALDVGAIKIIGGANIEFGALAYPYTFPTGPEGRMGVLRWQGEWPVIPGRLTCERLVVEDEYGEPVAFVLVSPTRGARPLPNLHPILATPTVVVSAEDGVRLRNLVTAAAGKLPVRVTSPPIWEGPLRSANLVVELAGRGPTVVLLAHYDCVEGSPGANDNASGTALLLRLIQRLRAEPPSELAYRFVFCGAEEPFLAGSRTEAADLAARQDLARVAACLNFDMVGVGERFLLRRPAGSVWQTVATQLDGTSPTGRVFAETDAVASSDQWAFHELGVPSAQLTRGPDPAWHAPDDTVARYSEADLQEAEIVALRLLEGLRDALAHDSAPERSARRNGQR